MRLAILAAASGFILAATPALAGFTWTPPASTMAAQPAAPIEPPVTGGLSPMPYEAQPIAAPAPAPMAPVQPMPLSPSAAAPAAPEPSQVSDFEAPALNMRVGVAVPLGRSGYAVGMSTPVESLLPPAQASAPSNPSQEPVAPTQLPTATNYSTPSYEEPVQQKNAIRPIRIDTRPAIAMAPVPMRITPPVTTTVDTTNAAPVDWGMTPSSVLPVGTNEVEQNDPHVRWTSGLVASNTRTNLTIADGFGRDIPLAMAVRQIVPEGYGMAFDRSVNMDQTITWEGGKDWFSVLNDALRPQGLTASLQGQVVRIRAESGKNMNYMAPRVMGSNDFTLQDTLQSGVQLTPRTETPVALPTLQDTAAAPTAVTAAESAAPQTQAAAPAQAAMTAAPDMSAPQQAATAIAMPQQIEPASGGDMYDAQDMRFMQPLSPAVAVSDIQLFTAQRGMSLRETLDAWSEQAGVELHWSSAYDFPLVTDVQLEGSFEAVVKNLLKGFEKSQPKPVGRLHPNLPNGPAVLIIETGTQ